MLVQILSVTKTPAVSKAGKPYEFLDIAFKNLTFQGKVEGKKLMPFGENKGAFTALQNAQQGQTYDVQVVKNAAGYNDWVGATVSNGQTPAVQAAPTYRAPAASAQVGGNSRGFPTEEERAKTQLHIIRQSSVKSAVDALTPGAKAPLKLDDITALARGLENYVLGIDEAPSFEDIPDFDTPE